MPGRDCVVVACVLLAHAVTLAQSTPRSGVPSAEHINGALLARHLPRVEYRGGPIVRRPRLVTITFAGDDPQVVSRLERFADTIARTPWWRAVVDGYCVRDGDCIGESRSSLPVRLDEKLPPDVHAVDISALLRRYASAGRLGPLDSDSLLLVYLPSGVSLRDAFVAQYCRDGPRAFHRAFRVDDKTVGYAVLPRCAGEAALTGSASHELLEMVTNPDTSRPGFAFAGGSATSGFTGAGHEPMDPCGVITRQTETVEAGFVVRRAWSNRAASQGHDPCVPADVDRPYVALVPQQPTVRLLNDGDSITLVLVAAADRPVAQWAVSAVVLAGVQEHVPCVEVALDRSVVAPGEAATLRITRRAAQPKPLSFVGIVSTLGADSFVWPVAVAMR
jgi:hypothetical protein